MSNYIQDIHVVGDIHGDWDILFRKIDHLGIGNCYLIHVGDGGEGFLPESKQMRQFEHHNDRFKKYNIQYMSIRGNHSDPKYFQGNVKLSNFELLPDYTYRELNGEKFLFVGGGISIDRKYSFNGRFYRVKDVSWWEDEALVFKPELVEKVDVLVTHGPPSWNGPNEKSGIAGYCENDETLWEDCVKEREDIDNLIKLSSPKKHYCGHHHLSSFVSMNGCDSRILDMIEIMEHR